MGQVMEFARFMAFQLLTINLLHTFVSLYTFMATFEFHVMFWDLYSYICLVFCVGWRFPVWGSWAGAIYKRSAVTAQRGDWYMSLLLVSCDSLNSLLEDKWFFNSHATFFVKFLFRLMLTAVNFPRHPGMSDKHSDGSSSFFFF